MRGRGGGVGVGTKSLITMTKVSEGGIVGPIWSL